MSMSSRASRNYKRGATWLPELRAKQRFAALRRMADVARALDVVPARERVLARPCPPRRPRACRVKQRSSASSARRPCATSVRRGLRLLDGPQGPSAAASSRDTGATETRSTARPRRARRRARSRPRSRRRCARAAASPRASRLVSASVAARDEVALLHELHLGAERDAGEAAAAMARRLAQQHHARAARARLEVGRHVLAPARAASRAAAPRSRSSWSRHGLKTHVPSGGPCSRRERYCRRKSIDRTLSPLPRLSAYPTRSRRWRAFAPGAAYAASSGATNRSSSTACEQPPVARHRDAACDQVLAHPRDAPGPGSSRRAHQERDRRPRGCRDGAQSFEPRGLVVAHEVQVEAVERDQVHLALAQRLERFRRACRGDRSIRRRAAGRAARDEAREMKARGALKPDCEFAAIQPKRWPKAVFESQSTRSRRARGSRCNSGQPAVARRRRHRRRDRLHARLPRA